MSNLYLGIKGHVVCIDQTTGTEQWKTKLKGMSITNVFCDSNNIFAYASGHLFCLEPSFGKILWKNPLTGYGYGTCIFGTNNSNAHQQSVVLAHDEIQKNSQAAQSTT